MKHIWLPKNQRLEKIVQNHFPDVQFDERFSETLFISASEKEILDTVLSKEKSIHNDSLLLIEAIHANKTNNAVWNNIKLHEKVRVTVDMFYCGAVFFRKEQVKEHFKIRI